MDSTVEDCNEKHLSPWSEACEKDGIHTTPLSPYLDQVSQVTKGTPNILAFLQALQAREYIVLPILTQLEKVYLSFGFTTVSSYNTFALILEGCKRGLDNTLVLPPSYRW